MYANLRNHIYKLFSRFLIKVYLLARRMNLRQVLLALEMLVRKAGLSQPDAITTNAVAPNHGPVYSLGYSPTAAKYILKANEGSNFPNIYPGTMPPDGSWGTFLDNDGVSYTIHPLIATELTMEQLWDFYKSTAPDPISGGTDEDRRDEVGPFMRGSTFDLGDFDYDGNSDHNYDGDTTFLSYGSGAPT